MKLIIGESFFNQLFRPDQQICAPHVLKVGMQNMCMFLTCTVLVSRWIYYWGFELKFRLQSLVIRICELVTNCCVINFRGFGCCIQNRDRIMERIG